ncbi:MAG TPA: ATP-binding protein [Anaerolineae bacterium]|nr:ATP-binding protein [Anaerolineae bacterium]
MNQLPNPETATTARRTLNLGIRGKVTIPYLVLTFAVAFVGVFIVTRYVTDSFAERFANQLKEAARVAGDGFVGIEQSHLDMWRILAATEGVQDAVTARDLSTIRALVDGPARSRSVDSVWVVDPQAIVLVGLDRTPNGDYAETNNFPFGEFGPLERALRGESDEFGDKFAGIQFRSGQPYLVTAGPLEDGGKLFGAILIGTRLDRALRSIDQQAAASISTYDTNGDLLGTTLPGEGGPPGHNRLTPDQINEIVSRAAADDNQAGPRYLSGDLQHGSALYRLLYAPLRIRQSVIGAYSVGLPSDFLFLTSANSRLLFAFIFTAMVLAVVVVGFLVSRRLIAPVLQLVRTSQAVASGDLSQRTGLSGGDEIGLLANTFDDMTYKLQERTRDLELLLQAHREEAFKIRAILASIADGVLVLDPQGRIIMMNAAAEHILGDLSADFKAGLFREQPIDPIEPQPESMALIESAEKRRFELNNRTISTHAAPVIMPDSHQLGTVIVLRDITHEAEIDRLKDHFIEQTSHELRTPLTAIKGYSDLMLQTSSGEIPEKYMEFLNTINRHADSLVSMITDLLDISQMEAGAMSLRRERIDLNELVDVALSEWRKRFAEKELALEVNLAPEPVAITGDRRRLNWAIRQLVSNAYHYTESGGRVTVSVAGDADVVSISVQDTGIGITPEDQKFLFTRFFRSTTRVHSNERGVGLGLYIVKAVAEAHRGKVEVRSVVGEGSTFRLLLPIEEDDDEPPVVNMLNDTRP